MLFHNKVKKVTIDSEIDRLLTDLNKEVPGTDAYRKLRDDLTVLTAARANKNPSALSRDTIVMGFVNLAGILLVLNFEKFGTITSKAFGNVQKVGRN